MCCPDQSDSSFILFQGGEESGGGTASRPININCQQSVEGKLLSLMRRETCTDGCLRSFHLSVMNPERVFYSRLMLSVHKPRQLGLLLCSFRTDGKAPYIKALVKICSEGFAVILQSYTLHKMQLHIFQFTKSFEFHILKNAIFLKLHKNPDKDI